MRYRCEGMTIDQSMNTGDRSRIKDVTLSAADEGG